MPPDFVALAQESGTVEAFEAGVLAGLEREIGSDVAFLTVRGNEGSPTARALDERIVERAVAGGERYFRDLLPVKRAALGARGVAVDTEVLGLARVRELAYHRELAIPAGVRHTLMAYVPWRGNVIAAIMLARAGAGFGDVSVRRLEALLPTLGVARAAFGLPWVSDPLPPVEPRFFQRLRAPDGIRSLATVRTAEGKLVVQDRNGYREMVAHTGDDALVWTRASVEKPTTSGWPYIELFHVAAAMASRRTRALFVGCGGGVVLRQFASAYPGITMDVVEREAKVIELARRWFALDAIPNLSVHLADGADFIARAAAERWDLVVIDAYDGTGLATGFSTNAFFAAVRRVLRPGGAMAQNLIATLDGKGSLPEVVAAVSAEFGLPRIVPVMDPESGYDCAAVRNVVVMARRADP